MKFIAIALICSLGYYILGVSPLISIIVFIVCYGLCMYLFRNENEYIPISKLFDVTWKIFISFLPSSLLWTIILAPLPLKGQNG